MSIVRLNRLTLAGLTRDKYATLEQLQQLGVLHLLPLTPAPSIPEQVPPEHAVAALQALRYLREVPDKRRQVREAADFDIAATARQVLANRQRLRDANDRRDTLRQRLAELEPWGEFAFPEPGALAGRKLWFYCVPRRLRRALETLDLPWQAVHQDHRQIWVAVVHTEEPPADALPVPRAHTGALSLSEVRRRLEAAELELEEALAERHALTRWIWQMASHLAVAEDHARIEHAEALTLDDGALFAVQGWVAERDLPAVTALAEQQGLALLAEPPSVEDMPPTLLDNPAPLAAGEDLVAFYQMPPYRAWDPSRVLFFSFTAFFAMILSDAGYAGVLALPLALFWPKLGQSATGRRLRLLAAALVGVSFAWGVAIGSYFGFAPPEGLLSRLAVLDIQDFDSMMRLSVGIGVVHLLLANLEMLVSHGWRAPGRVALGWMLVLASGFALWLGMDAGAPAWLAPASQAGIAGGLAWILLAGSDRRIDGLAALAWRALDGIGQLVKVTQVFGDVLSYLRLFALGLASASLALTFNGLARDVASGMPGLGLLFAILILFVGHALNLLLGLMSGVVHGLRLNFIEFYNWSLSGEGYPFKPLRKTAPGSLVGGG